MTQDPFSLFDTWYAEARVSEPNDSNAMALSTVDAQGVVSARMVLLKGHDASGFVFYTNRESRKARDLIDDASVALLFHWKSLRRQIRIEGRVGHATGAESDAYFASRGRDSQLGAWASDQSRPMPDRATFEARFDAMQAKFEGRDVPRPPHWGGYRVTPARIEFWRDGAHRLHERTLYTRSEAGDAANWTTELLYP